MSPELDVLLQAAAGIVLGIGVSGAMYLLAKSAVDASPPYGPRPRDSRGRRR